MLAALNDGSEGILLGQTDAGIQHTYHSISDLQLRGMRECIGENRLEEKARPLRCTADTALHTMGGRGRGRGKVTRCANLAPRTSVTKS